MRCLVPAFMIFVFSLIIGSIGFSIYTVYNTQNDINITVTDKERVTYSSGESVSSKYLIYTETEVFECTDNLLVGKFNSSDIYGQLRKDSTYLVTVYGYRVPYLSWYRNIIKIKE